MLHYKCKLDVQLSVFNKFSNTKINNYLYAFTHFRNRYPLGHVWMNLHKINSEEYAAVTVRPKVKFEETFYKKYFIDRI